MTVPKLTIDALGAMMQRQFEEIMAVLAGKADKSDISRLDTRMDRLEIRMDRIENIILTDHRNRLERIEDTIRILETKSES